jgi:hypothetical protein
LVRRGHGRARPSNTCAQGAVSGASNARTEDAASCADNLGTEDARNRVDNTCAQGSSGCADNTRSQDGSGSVDCTGAQGSRVYYPRSYSACQRQRRVLGQSTGWTAIVRIIFTMA